MIELADISQWQNAPSTIQQIDYVKMKTKSPAVIFKCSQDLHTDPEFLLSWKRAKDLGFIRGCYLFLDYSPGKASGIDQARYFCNAFASDPPDMPPIIDYEKMKDVAPPTNLLAILQDCVSEVEDITHRKPMIYFSPSMWLERGSTDAYWASFPLWIAHWEAVKPTIPAPWTDWKIWQHTSKGPGKDWGMTKPQVDHLGVESFAIDLDWFNGTIEDLRAFCGIKDPVLTVRMRTKQLVNVRSGPLDTAPILGTLPGNTLVQVDGKSGTRSHIISPKVGWVWTDYLAEAPMTLEEQVALLTKEARLRGWPV